MDGSGPALLRTARLQLLPLTLDDAPFILNLVNQPSWLRFIGDKNVRDLEGAQRYLREGAFALYERHGFGPMRVTLGDGKPIGMCGLFRRDALPEPDLGFAFLPDYWGAGYAREAAAAVLGHARSVVGLPRVLAITSPDNHASGRLLEHVGFRFRAPMRLPNGDEVRLYAIEFGAPT